MSWRRITSIGIEEDVYWRSKRLTKQEHSVWKTLLTILLLTTTSTYNYPLEIIYINNNNNIMYINKNNNIIYINNNKNLMYINNNKNNRMYTPNNRHTTLKHNANTNTASNCATGPWKSTTPLNSPLTPSTKVSMHKCPGKMPFSNKYNNKI